MSEEFLIEKTLVDQAFEGILLLDEKFEVTFSSKKADHIFKTKGQTLVGRSILPFFHDLFKTTFQEMIASLKKEEVSITKEVVLKAVDQELVPALIRPFLFEEKQIGLYVLDISEQKIVQDKLFESQERFNSIINTAVDAIITISDKGEIETINPSASKLFGYSPEELIGKKVNVLMPEPDRTQHDQYMENYHQTRKPKIIGIGREVTGMKKDGTKFPLTLGVSEVKLRNRVIYTGIIHDLTEQKLTEEKLRRLAEDLKRSNRELEDFAYVSSHDLQEPLRKIRAFGERVISSEKEKLSPKSADYLDRMMNAAERMQNLINDLLSFSRVSSRAKPFTRVDLNQVLEEVLIDLELMIEKSGAEVSFNGLPTIEADPTQMRQLFQNLISNAIKFTPEKRKPEIKVIAEVEQLVEHMSGTPGDEMLTIKVQDNGMGFNTKYLDKIFNIFTQLEGKKYKGSGIGLSICKKIVNRHGGDITADSKIGEGTTFIIKLATRQTA